MAASLSYRTFDELLQEVQLDLPAHNQEGMIEPAQLLKVAQRVSYDLGLRIHPLRQAVLDLEHHHARLPHDWQVVHYALLLDKPRTLHQTPATLPAGHLELVTTQTGLCLQESTGYGLRHYERAEPIEIESHARLSTQSYRSPARHRAQIRDNHLFVSAPTGRLYLCYEGQLQDEEGNLLVPDHPVLNEYYEYALKSRILENLYLAGEEVSQRMQLIEGRLRAARNNALSLVNTPDFGELKAIWESNRRAQHLRYYQMFSSFPTLPNSTY